MARRRAAWAAIACCLAWGVGAGPGHGGASATGTADADRAPRDGGVRPQQSDGVRYLDFVASSQIGGAYSGVATSGGLAFATRGRDLEVLDVSRPGEPAVLASATMAVPAAA
jgi:hypothetical protein